MSTMTSGKDGTHFRFNPNNVLSDNYQSVFGYCVKHTSHYISLVTQDFRDDDLIE